jgi:hypothetical protein
VVPGGALVPGWVYYLSHWRFVAFHGTLRNAG